jgi:hypothetical protein
VADELVATVPAPRWALGAVTDIPDLRDPASIYLRRYRLVETPWFGIFLHKILLADGDRDLHDHPWHFATVIVRGGYCEEVEAAAGRLQRRWRAGSVHGVRATDCHSIRSLLRVPTWTLVVVGRRRREWGFATGEGWVAADAYERDQTRA